MSQPLLTIAIPTYNRAKLLDGCLSAIVSQIKLYGEQIEIIVSNNASTDNTEEVVIKHQELIPALRYLENEKNLGPDYNINMCFQAAKGKYVWIFSDDDILLSGYMSDIISLLNTNNLGLIYLSSLWFEPADIPIIKYEKFSFTLYQNKTEFIKFVNYWFTFITGNIINKNLLIDNGFTYEFHNTNLIQLGWILPVVFLSDNAVVNIPIVACRSNNSGGYKIYKTFSTNFNYVMNVLLRDNKISKESKDIINENLINDFFPRTIRNNSKDFDDESVIFTLTKAFWNYKSFWFRIIPVYILRFKAIYMLNEFFVKRAIVYVRIVKHKISYLKRLSNNF